MTTVASFTKTYREAQTYLTFVLLVPTLPLVFATMLNIEPEPKLMWIPSLSQHLLITTLIKDQPLTPSFVAISVGEHPRVRRAARLARRAALSARSNSRLAARTSLCKRGARAFCERVHAALGDRRGKLRAVGHCSRSIGPMSETPLAEKPPSPPSFDALTLTLTRPAFLEELAEQAQLAQRSGNVFSLLLLDVDHLQNINDCHGVAAGDDVLVGLADRCRRVIAEPAWHRSEYSFGRYDGGALIVLARPCAVEPGRDAGRGAALRRRREAVRATASARPSRSASRSCASASPSTSCWRAPSAYCIVAKQFGRDRVEVASAPPSRVERAKVVGLYD